MMEGSDTDDAPDMGANCEFLDGFVLLAARSSFG